jgi:hypothetical protein
MRAQNIKINIAIMVVKINYRTVDFIVDVSLESNVLPFSDIEYITVKINDIRHRGESFYEFFADEHDTISQIIEEGKYEIYNYEKHTKNNLPPNWR